jgi:triosephosphate isomerase
MKKLILANWKMQLSFKESLKLARDYGAKIKKATAEIGVLPDFSALEGVRKNLPAKVFKLGAQDVAPYAKGAYTGEVSATSLKQLGVKYVLIGHSERRQEFKETSSLLRLKVQAALEVGLVPVLCIGENASQKKNGQTAAVLRRQLEEVLFGLVIEKDEALVVAYEPLWAIGSGQPLAPAQAEAIQVMIKGVLANLLGRFPRVLYGGSVNAKNAADFLEWPNIDGLLVGGASLKADDFKKIIGV